MQIIKNKELVQRIRQTTSGSAETTAELVEMTTGIIARILSQGDSLAIKGFGTFEVKKKEERLSVNPATGRRYLIPPKLVPGFKPGTTLKEKLKIHSGYEQ